MDPLLNVAIEAARCGSKVLLQSMDRIDRLEIKEKSPLDFVSSVDHQSEYVIKESLKTAYPKYSILAEESGLEKGEEPNYCWVIDPLDGTTNYLKQIPHFAISIALLKDNRPIHAVIYDPVRDEMFTASKGLGAFCNNTRMRVQQSKNHIKGAYMALGGPAHRDQEHWFQQMDIANILINKSAGIRRMGSAALDLAYVAAGRVDGYWGVKLKPWDYRAGELLIKEAGGYIADFKGTHKFIESGNILAAEPKLLHDLVANISEIYNKSTNS